MSDKPATTISDVTPFVVAAAASAGHFPEAGDARTAWSLKVHEATVALMAIAADVANDAARTLKRLSITGVLSVPPAQRNRGRVNYVIDAGGKHPDSLWTPFCSTEDERSAWMRLLKSLEGQTVTLDKVTIADGDGNSRSEAAEGSITVDGRPVPTPGAGAAAPAQQAAAPQAPAPAAPAQAPQAAAAQAPAQQPLPVQQTATPQAPSGGVSINVNGARQRIWAVVKPEVSGRSETDAKAIATTIFNQLTFAGDLIEAARVEEAIANVLSPVGV